MKARRPSEPANKMQTRLFVSHSSEDQGLVEALIDLIDSSLAVPDGAIRCTSDYRSKLVPGASVAAKLRREIEDCEVVIGFLTPASLNSSYVLMELGAAWGLKRYVIPVLAGGVEASDIPGPIGGGVHAAEVDNEASIADVLNCVSLKCDMKARGTSGARQESVKRFAEKARSHRKRRVSPTHTIEDLENFPAFLPMITQLIQNAPPESEIQIACDYVGYGMFNAGEDSDKYRDALMEARRRGCNIRILALGSKPWEQQRAGVPDRDHQIFEQLIRMEVFKKNLDAFARRMRELKLPVPKAWTRASHLEALVQVELHYQKMLKAAGIQITIVRGPLPLYLWITQSCAVWVLCPLEPKMRFPLIWYDLLTEGRINKANPLDEHGFLSSDKNLVNRFRYVWEQYNTAKSRATATVQG